MTVDTARSPGAGRLLQGERGRQLATWPPQVENAFCALTLSALDDQPIARAGSCC